MKYKIVFFHNKTKEKTAKELRNILDSQNWEEVDDDPSAEFIFVIGGDGSFFHFVKEYAMLDKNLVGIRAGNVSFSLDFETLRDIGKILGEAQWRHLRFLEIKAGPGTKHLAMNDVFVRGKLFLTADVRINDIPLETFRRSGLLFSTQYGSTGMNKSIGGPIIIHDHLWIMNEVGTCNTNSNVSLSVPLVLDEGHEVKLKFPTRNSFHIFADGRRLPGYGQKNLSISLTKGTSRVLKIEIGEYVNKIRDIFLV